MKKLKLILSVMMVTGILATHGQTQVSSFPNLKTLTLSNGIHIHYAGQGVEIFNKICRQLPPADPFYADMENPGSENIKALKIKIAETDAEPLIVLYTDGPSGDPAFIFARSAGGEIAELGGTELYIPGNGFVYTAGHTNTSFNKRSKFAYNGKEFTEVKQAYYYVGLNTRTTREITIYADREKTQPVATLAPDSEVEVLLTDYHHDFGGNEYFLLRTPFGLTGWFSCVTYSLGEEPPLKGIFFAGD